MDFFFYSLINLLVCLIPYLCTFGGKKGQKNQPRRAPYLKNAKH